MALSDYDTLAVDHNGMPTDGVFVSPSGVTVSVRKTWLSISDPKSWRKGGAFMEPVVMNINEGDLTYQDVRIRAVLGRKGIYAVVSSSAYLPMTKDKDGKDVYVDPTVTGMLVIGVYGYKHEAAIVLAKLGRKIKPNQEWHSVSSTKNGKTTYAVERTVADKKRGFRIAESIPHKKIPWSRLWIGVEKSDVELLAKLARKHAPKSMQNIKLSKALRYNQGDRYFADNVKGLGLAATKPGKKSEPLLAKILGKMLDEGK